MSFFSPFAFKFGVLLFLCICLSNLVYSWLCLIFKVRILKFALLSDPWDKSIFKKNIGHTEIILGWLPLGGYIKPLGMLVEDGEINTMLEEEKPFALVNKSKFHQRIFKSSPYFVLLMLFCFFVYLINPNDGFVNNLHSLFDFTIASLKAMFGYFPKNEFQNYASEFISNYQLLPFSLLFFYLSFLVLSPLNMFFQNEKQNIIIKWIGGIIILASFYVFYWKIPVFLFSFFSLINIIKYIFWTITGIYVAGIICFWLVVPLIKLNSTK